MLGGQWKEWTKCAGGGGLEGPVQINSYWLGYLLASMEGKEFYRLNAEDFCKWEERRSALGVITGVIPPILWLDSSQSILEAISERRHSLPNQIRPAITRISPDFSSTNWKTIEEDDPQVNHIITRDMFLSWLEWFNSLPQR